MATGNVTKKAFTYLLGVCVPSPKQNAAKIRIRSLELDEHISMYFRKYDFVFAADPEKLCKTGDTVLIKTLPEKLTRHITHKIVEVIYPLGDMTDPVTGKKIVAGRYRDHIREDAMRFGELESMYKYEEAPPRGKTENKRDFTSKETYVKYQEGPDDPKDPYCINPY
ncbi:28S ribosomal protein S17, mitochondrial [Ceratina calcarata]|uniref:28S ribosomal protein S17, mitochondrial n=1 Tax=Ceratina calcarata TaxID=156304 RepID=A0AAJ7J2N2_9HYME|nr:28S ribosomal protein S17, mitochondrial [Ceratina calcarata]